MDTPTQAASLPRSSRLDFLGSEPAPNLAIVVAKGMKDGDWTELVSGSPPEPGLEAGDRARYSYQRQGKYTELAQPTALDHIYLFPTNLSE